MPKRKIVKKAVENQVLMASRRRCCLCFFLDGIDKVRKGQIAHLNKNRTDSQFENLAFLCLEHHDEYDSSTSQSKAFLIEEVRQYRNRLYAKNPEFKAIMQSVDNPWTGEGSSDTDLSLYEKFRLSNPDIYDYTLKSWRYPLWQVANEPEFFAYKAGNRADGVCLIERIDVPDGRIVIVCIQTSGNPGNSITNCVEELCFQVCERFEIPPERLVWLEHYNDELDHEWRWVTFDTVPSNGPFADPNWNVMTSKMWRSLHLRPRKRLRLKPYGLGYESKVTKLFDWPTENLF